MAAPKDGSLVSMPVCGARRAENPHPSFGAKVGDPDGESDAALLSTCRQIVVPFIISPVMRLRFFTLTVMSGTAPSAF